MITTISYEVSDAGARPTMIESERKDTNRSMRRTLAQIPLVCGRNMARSFKLQGSRCAIGRPIKVGSHGGQQPEWAHKLAHEHGQKQATVLNDFGSNKEVVTSYANVANEEDEDDRKDNKAEKGLCKIRLVGSC